MPLSSYQVEWLIHQRRRWHGLLQMVERALFSGGDKVQLSEEAGSQAAELTPQPRTPVRDPEVWPLDVADSTAYPPSVDYELERRAGSFMEPSYPAHPPPAGIPRVRHPEPDPE